MNSRRLVQLTGLGLILFSGAYFTYANLTRGKPYAVTEIDTPAPTLGSTSPKVILVADLACPHCRDFDSAKGKRLEEQARSGESQLTYVLIARQEGGDVAGNAALCAFEQNPQTFWPYKTELYKLEQITPESVLSAAATFDLDQRILAECVAQQKHVQTLEHNEQLVRDAGIQGTPTLIVNGLAHPNPSTATVVEVTGE